MRTYHRFFNWIVTIILTSAICLSAIPEVYFMTFVSNNTIEVYDLIDYNSEVEKSEKEKEDQKIRTGTKSIGAISLRYHETGFMKEAILSMKHLETDTPPPERIFA